MVDVDILLGNEDSAWFAANSNHVLKDGQIVYLNDNSGKFKKGDGVTTLSSLPFIGGSQTLAEVLATGNKTSQTNIESDNGLWHASIFNDWIEFGGVNGGYYKDADGTFITDGASVDIDSAIFTKQGVNVATENYVDTAVGTKEDSANKSTTMTGNTTSNIVFLTAKAIFDWATSLFTPQTRNITINGNTQNLAVDRTFNVGNGFKPIYSGFWRTIDFINGSSTGSGTYNGALYFIPYIIGITHKVTDIGLEIVTPQAGSNIRLALYSDVNGLPDTLIEESGNIPSTTSGLKIYTFASPITLSSNNQIVWLGVQVSSATVSIRNAINSVCSLYVDGISVRSSTAFKLQAFGAFPSTATPTYSTSNNVPLICLKVQ